MSSAEHKNGILEMYREVRVEIDDSPALVCTSPNDLALHVGDDCIVEHDHALDFGKVARIDQRDGDAPSDPHAPRVVRCATLQDQSKAEENSIMSKMAMDKVNARAEKYDMDINILGARYSFDKSVLRVLFSSEDHVNCRELIKELAGDMGVKVVMKQIGVRDEAGMIGGMGPCGRNLCCCSWLTKFDSINVKMAKTQNLSLHPEIISGKCGRLKCCLRYEHDNYRDLARHVPRDGSRVECPDGTGEVVERNILAQKVRIRLEDGRMVGYRVDQVSKARAAVNPPRAEKGEHCEARGSKKGRSG